MFVKRIIRLNLVVLLFLMNDISLFGQFNYVTNHDSYITTSCPQGIYVDTNKFNINLLYPKESWIGHWIWLDTIKHRAYQETQIEWSKNPNYKRQYKALFRKSFDLAEVPDQVIMSLTADISFRVYINEIFVAQGPPNIGNDYFDGTPPKHWFYTTHDIKKYLNSGINTISVEVFSHFREISETSSRQGMLLCDIEDGNGKNIAASDTTWRCIPDTSFTVSRGNFLNNANFEISDWKKIPFDDSDWRHASTKAFPKNNYLINSKIPIPIRYPVEPVRLWLPGDTDPKTNFKSEVFSKQHHIQEFALDYDRNMTAYVGFEVIAHENDTIKIQPYEKMYASQNRALTFICKEGVNVFYAPYLSVFRYLKVKVISEKGMTINTIRADFSSYPIRYTGNFSCSDENLTQLWDITRWTTQLCMNDMFYDSPKHQEPIACTGDYFIQSLINYYAFGDPWLTRQTLLKTALMLEKNHYDMFHTSYSLLWVQMLNQYFQYTGDSLLVRELLPHVNRLNQLFESYLDDEFLVSNAPDYMFMDWIKIDKFNAHHPPAVIGMGYMTAFYYKSLLDGAYLNSLADNIQVHDKNLDLAKKIKTAMNILLWDEKKQRYKDGIPFRSKSANHYFFPKDTSITTYSPHVNTLAVLYDIAPEDKKTALLNYVVRQDEIDLQPYFSFFVLSAIDHTGQFNTLGLEMLKKWENGINLETYTLKENWQDKTETGYGGDYSHAWGGSPLFFLSRNLLGIKPGSPGYKEVEIHPFISDSITWAKGKVPLADGRSIGISWTRAEGLKYVFALEIPENCKAVMVIPEDLVKKPFSLNNMEYTGDTNRIQMTSGLFEIEFPDQ